MLPAAPTDVSVPLFGLGLFSVHMSRRTDLRSKSSRLLLPFFPPELSRILSSESQKQAWFECRDHLLHSVTQRANDVHVGFSLFDADTIVGVYCAVQYLC